MNFELSDLVIRLDEHRQVLQFLVPDRNGRQGDLRVFYEIAAHDLEAAGNSIEQSLGDALLSFLSATYTTDAFGLDRYRAAAKDMEKLRSRDLKKESAKGDASAMYELAMQTIAHGLRAKSRSKMQRADRLLRDAAAAGSAEAAAYLVDLWPALRDRSIKNFK